MTADIKAAPGPVTEGDFRAQMVKLKRCSTSVQLWEVDVRKEWVSNEHQSVRQKIINDHVISLRRDSQGTLLVPDG